jgi:sulfate transport system ATP-binding protein
VRISVRNLVKRFGADSVAVNDVSFEAPEGKITALLGPSGSGKSTVLRIIAGLEEADGGSVWLDGKDASRLPPQARNVGFVFQSYALFKHMTVADNVAYGLRVRRRPRADTAARVKELLALVQLDVYAARYPSQLSGGQRQRVAVARALAPRPGVLLLDEPFGALDAQVRVELRAALKRVHRELGSTMVFVTHDQAEAMELSDHVVLLREGRVEQTGTAAEIYDRPATPFVASFIGSVSVLSGHVQNGKAAIGQLTVDVGAAEEGALVKAFVRAHDVAVSRSPDDAVASARVDALVRVGATYKVTLRLADGQPLTVELAKDVVDEMRISEGDHVFVNLREARVFVQDYAI